MMTQRLRLLGYFLLAFLGTFFTASAAAAPLPATLDFALHLARLDTSLHDGQQAVDATVKQLGVASFDIGQRHLQPGLAVGYAYVSDSSQAATAGLELQGFYIAPALRGILLEGQRLNATLTATYLYQRVKDSNDEQAVTMEWQQPQVDLDVKCRITRQWNLLLGGQYGRIDVDETLSGQVDQTLTLRSSSTLGYRAGLEIDLDDNGQVGVLVHHALSDGVELYFQRQF